MDFDSLKEKSESPLIYYRLRNIRFLSRLVNSKKRGSFVANFATTIEGQ